MNENKHSPLWRIYFLFYIRPLYFNNLLLSASPASIPSHHHLLLSALNGMDSYRIIYMHRYRDTPIMHMVRMYVIHLQ